MDLIFLNVQVIVILLSILIRYEEMLSRLVSWCEMQYIIIHLITSKQWFTHYEKNEGNKIVRLNTIFLN